MNSIKRLLLVSGLVSLCILGTLFEAQATNDQAVGLAIEINNGVGAPLQVKAGQDFYIDQIDMRTYIDTKVDKGVSGLEESEDFASLPWDGISLSEEEFLELANPDGTFTRRRFFVGAAWMKQPSFFVINPINAQGMATSLPVVVTMGNDPVRKMADTMFINRLRAIQWTFDCASKASCTDADNFQEEALIEIRSTNHPEETLSIPVDTTALQVRWSLKPSTPYLIPLERVADPQYGYGYTINIESLTPPQSDGTYLPGTEISFRLSQHDGSGTRLHLQDVLPSYNEFLAGKNQAGLQYYRSFIFLDPSATYYRRKHRERMLMAQVIGPVHKLTPIRRVLQLEDFLGDNVTKVLARPEIEGLYSEYRIFPPAPDLFGGAFDPKHVEWDNPVSTKFTFTIPENADPGTYYVTAKGRRVYLGQDIAGSTTIEIQVGTTERGQPRLTTGGCSKCHVDGGEQDKLLHRNPNMAACNGCHTPMTFELDNIVLVRAHFIHSRSDRYDAPLSQCSACHPEESSIQRTSKAACLSCHRSYPESHVKLHGPIHSIYVGGETESFDRCATSCHRAHPGSGY